VRGRGAEHVGNAEAREFAQHLRLVHAVDLVDDEHRRLAGAAQRGEDVLVLRQDAIARVHHEDAQVGFLDGGHRLLRREPGHAFVFAAQAAGVHEYEGAAVDLAANAVVAVARDARLIVHQGVARARERVENRGFTDVRSADQGDQGQHGCSRYCRR
jgi:hypothetical protein